MTAREPDRSGLVATAPEERVEQARVLAWRALGRREHTEHELGRALARRGIEPTIAEQVVRELVTRGYVDDAAYARRFAEDRRRLDGWGSERIAGRLRAAGVPGDAIAAAVACQNPEEELDAALAVLQRRFPHPEGDRRARDRMLGALLRRGYNREIALAALRRLVDRAAGQA